MWIPFSVGWYFKPSFLMCWCANAWIIYCRGLVPNQRGATPNSVGVCLHRRQHAGEYHGQNLMQNKNKDHHCNVFVGMNAQCVDADVVLPSFACVKNTVYVEIRSLVPGNKSCSLKPIHVISSACNCTDVARVKCGDVWMHMSYFVFVLPQSWKGCYRFKQQCPLCRFGIDSNKWNHETKHRGLMCGVCLGCAQFAPWVRLCGAPFMISWRGLALGIGGACAQPEIFAPLVEELGKGMAQELNLGPWLFLRHFYELVWSNVEPELAFRKFPSWKPLFLFCMCLNTWKLIGHEYVYSHHRLDSTHTVVEVYVIQLMFDHQNLNLFSRRSGEPARNTWVKIHNDRLVVEPWKYKLFFW